MTTESKKEYQRQYRIAHAEELKKKQKEYRQIHAAEIRERNRNYMATHPDKKKTWGKNYYENHKEEVTQKHTEWRKANPDYSKNYYSVNKDEFLEKAKEYRLENIDKIKRREKEYRITHSEQRRALCKQYYATHVEQFREYRRNNIERIRDTKRKWNKANEEKCKIMDYNKLRKRRNRILDHYGRVCACCGEYHEEFLAIDHIEGGGNIHRKTVGGGGNVFYSWLLRNNFPNGYRILCHNCNESLGHYGYCPHQRNSIPK